MKLASAILALRLRGPFDVLALRHWVPWWLANDALARRRNMRRYNGRMAI
jgi:hypothetical protein